MLQVISEKYQIIYKQLKSLLVWSIVLYLTCSLLFDFVAYWKPLPTIKLSTNQLKLLDWPAEYPQELISMQLINLILMHPFNFYHSSSCNNCITRWVTEIESPKKSPTNSLYCYHLFSFHFHFNFNNKHNYNNKCTLFNCSFLLYLFFCHSNPYPINPCHFIRTNTSLFSFPFLLFLLSCSFSTPDPGTCT